MPKIILQKQSIPYTIRESNRARRISLRIDNKKGLQIILPSGMEYPHIEELLHEKANWILKHHNRIQTDEQSSFAQHTYQTDDQFMFLGDVITLSVQQKSHGTGITTSFHEPSKILLVSLPPMITPGSTQAEVQTAVENWYRKQAKNYLPPRVVELAKQCGFSYQNLSIKNQKTRWGSCSAKGNLNFNLRLMMTPPLAIDYVIIHELCHLRELNHSKRFWSLVAHYCPEYKRWKRWLKDNNHRLQF